MKKKILFVVQRYGAEINGGAELHCKMIAERLVPDYDCTVLTSRAIDYVTWKDEYPEGEEMVNGVRVLRFSVDYPRDEVSFGLLSDKAYAFPADIALGEEWMRRQGPYSTDLLKYLKKHQDDYEKIIFFTYLYPTTYFGLLSIKDKSKVIFVPTAHDEPPIYLDIFKKLFSQKATILWNTPEERDLVHSILESAHMKREVPSDAIAAVGIEQYVDPVAVEEFNKKYNLGKYVLYVGRIDPAKGCVELCDYFLEYIQRKNRDLKLVFIGKAVIELPKDPRIMHLGFRTPEEVVVAMSQAEVTVVPSKYESLSMVLLEAHACGSPVIVNGNCEVLKGHCLRSNAGLWYSDMYEFIEGMEFFYDEKNSSLKEAMRENGKKYVKEDYAWEKVMGVWKNALEQ